MSKNIKKDRKSEKSVFKKGDKKRQRYTKSINKTFQVYKKLISKRQLEYFIKRVQKGVS